MYRPANPGAARAHFFTFFAGDGPLEWVRPIPKAPERSWHASGPSFRPNGRFCTRFGPFSMFLARLENQVWAKTWPEPPTRAADSGTFFWAPGWGFGAKFGPDLIFKLDQKHQKWSEMGPESTVWAENRSRSMPGPLRSLWDGSNPLKGAVPGQKSQKVCPKNARIKSHTNARH